MRKILFILSVSFLFLTNAMAQTRVVTGRITDDNGVGVANVSVQVRGSNVGTTTKSDGTFSLAVPANARQLVISSLGYEPQNLTLGTETTFVVKLNTAAARQLEEVVVTGIKNFKKTEYTGASTRMRRRDVENKPTGSFDNILQGNAPGLQAITGSGQPGNSATVTIRGSNSISGGTSPLYIIDGIPVEAGVFQSFNPNDFESIEILKDASAAALYGSRGSAGVIVVTTRRGSGGKMKLGYSVQMGIKSAPEFEFRPMTTPELLKAQESYGRIAGGTLPGWLYSPNNPRYATLTPTQQAGEKRIFDSISSINTNWRDLFFRDGNFSNHQITLSGGTGKTRLFSSLELYNEEGTTFRTDMKRLSLRNNMDYADDKLSFAFSSNIGYSRRNFQQSAVTNSTGNPFLVTNIASPYSKVRNADGSYVLGIGAAYVGTTQLDLTQYDENYNNQLKTLLGLTVNYKLAKGLTAAITGGVDFRETQTTVYGSKLAYSRRTSTSITGKAGFVNEVLNRYVQGDVRPSLNYVTTFNGKHKIDISAVGEYISQYTKGFNLTGYGIDPRTPGTPAAITQGNAANQLYSTVGGFRSQNSLVSGLGIFTYTYNDKYSFTGTYRQDGSSKLPPKTRWQDFYSVGAVWNISKESFLENNNFINQLRLRATYGGAGNADNFRFGDFGYNTLYGTGAYSGLNTVEVTNYGNPELKWETTYTTNVGVDFTLANSRVYGSFDVYDRRTKDLFVQKQLTAEGAGFARQDVNAGELQNKGFEYDLSLDVLKKKNIVWTLFGRGAYNKNKILSLGGLPSYPLGTTIIKEGKAIGSHYEVKWGGVDAATGAPLYYTKDGVLTTVYNASDKVQEFGTYEAPWSGGFGTILRVDAFELSVLFSWQKGGTKVDNLEYFAENPVGFLSGGYNQSSDLRFWTKPGDIASTPSPLYGSNFSSKIIHDASFVRLRDLSLSYTLPVADASRIKFLSKARFFVQGSNLFMWTKWRGMDPEAGGININLSEYPNPRAVTVGLDLTF